MDAIWALGMMSGTSLDGVDAALIKTDGERILSHGPWLTVPYSEAERALLRGVQGGVGDVAAADDLITNKHAAVAKTLIAQAAASGITPRVIGFHGQTILHQPQRKKTWQIGNGWKLAKALGIDVVGDFRSADVAAGGQGAPLVPVYHQALCANRPGPLVILNIGGVANVTYIGADGSLLAFDTGPGNALIDDWCKERIGEPIDRDGKLAAKGRIDASSLVRLGGLPYFVRTPPKSCDRNDFSIKMFERLSPPDGAATLTALTAMTIARARDFFPAPAKEWILCGGGRHNPTLMAKLMARVDDVSFTDADKLGWRGDAIEAEAFAFLAVRRLANLPITFPGTTGIKREMVGGVHFRHDQPEPVAVASSGPTAVAEMPVAPGPVQSGLPPELSAIPQRPERVAVDLPANPAAAAAPLTRPTGPAAPGLAVPGGLPRAPGLPGAVPGVAQPLPGGASAAPPAAPPGAAAGAPPPGGGGRPLGGAPAMPPGARPPLGGIKPPPRR